MDGCLLSGRSLTASVSQPQPLARDVSDIIRSTGDADPLAMDVLRKLGEHAARQLGLQPADIEAVGVDFAAFVLTGGLPRLEEHGGSQPAYLLRAAHWFAAKEARAIRQSARPAALAVSPDLPVPPTPSPEAELLERELADRIARAVAHLSEGEQRVFQVCLVEGRSSTEAAADLGCTPAAVRKRLQRLKAHLRRVLRPWMETED
jgi:RNA polymerase sigma factor (sigma-70 family)